MEQGLVVFTYFIGGIFALLILFIVYVFYKRHITNKYTRFAFIELFVALSIRSITCISYAGLKKNVECDGNLAVY